jgi:zinc transport system ATP-binding protein
MIAVENLCVKYESGYAVRDVSFTVRKGDYLCVVGENGSGKSTLMKAVLGLIKPSSGSVTFTGIKRSEIGFIPQQTVVQKDFPSSVYEVVLSGFQSKTGLLPFYSSKQKQKAKDNLQRLGAAELAKKSYRELSGGQQQRVLLARALCATELLIFLDEPATGLDPVMASELYAVLASLNGQGVAIVMISHDVQSAVKYGGTILHMATSPLFFGTAEEYARSKTGQKMLGGDENA